jgi:hypothetical protein
LFDFGLIRLVEAAEDEGYRGDHNELPAMSRDALKAELTRERDPTDTHRDKMIFYDPTPAGEAVLASVPRESIPRVHGTVRRPWQER